MVRLRLPGGRTSSTALRRLADLAVTYGNGILQLTSRAGLQIRGLPDPLPLDFVDGIVGAGLLPAASHERVRNIVTSPLTGSYGGLADLAPLTADLDAGLVAEPILADLPGRFLFALDDGRGDVVDLTFDLGYQAGGPDGGHVLVGSADRGFPVHARDAAPTLLRLATGFALARRTSAAWHVAELPEWVTGLGLSAIRPIRGTPAAPIGAVGGAASVLVPLARLSVEQARAVEALTGGGQVVVTPWRGLVLPGAADRLTELGAAGFIIDDESAWASVSACVGAPFCTRARIDTGRVAAALVAAGNLPRTHVAGCERRCGAPIGTHLDLVAPTVPQALTMARAASSAARSTPVP